MADSCKPPVKNTLQVILTEEEISAVLGSLGISETAELSAWTEHLQCGMFVDLCAFGPIDAKKLVEAYRCQFFTHLEHDKYNYSQTYIK